MKVVLSRIGTVFLAVMLAVNMTAAIRCVPSSTAPAIASHDATPLPDCCEDGLCPHHDVEHQKAPARGSQEEEDCVCSMSADEAPGVIAVSSVPARLVAGSFSIVLLSEAATPIRTQDGVPGPVLSPQTPPPRA